MADDSVEVTDDLPFGPTDSPRGMHYYNMDILTDNQQEQLNDCKLNTIFNIETYLNENPTIRALVALMYRAVLRTQPRQNLHLTIAEYFSKPRMEIQKDVNEYLQKRGPKREDFSCASKSEMNTEGSSERDILKIEKGDSKVDKDSEEHRSDLRFMRGLVMEHFDKMLDANKSPQKAVEMTKETENLPDADVKPTDQVTTTTADDSMFSDVKEGFLNQTDEEKLLMKLNQEYSEKHNSILQSIMSNNVDPQRARTWYLNQMIDGEKQWNLLQAALQGDVTPEVQDALRKWQIEIMDRTSNISPEMKEAQMDWLDGQLTQGRTMNRCMFEILQLWQSHILMLGSVMSPEMVRTEMAKLEQELEVAKELPIDVREDESERIEVQIIQMMRIESMLKSMQELERQCMQFQMNNLGESGILSDDLLKMQSEYLRLLIEHGILSQEEFQAKMDVLKDEMDYGQENTHETLLAHKKWIEWQLAEHIISQLVYDNKREFLNFQLAEIGVTSSQMLLVQMEWLDNEMKNNFMSAEAYNHQKIVLANRMAEEAKDTIPKIEEQIRWLSSQFELGNMSSKNFHAEKSKLKDKMKKLIDQNKTVDDLQMDLWLLYQEFGLGMLPESDFQTKKKVLRARIIQLKKSLSQTLLQDLRALEELFNCGGITTGEYDLKKLDLQRRLTASNAENATGNEKEILAKPAETNHTTDETKTDTQAFEAATGLEEDKQMADPIPTENQAIPQDSNSDEKINRNASSELETAPIIANETTGENNETPENNIAPAHVTYDDAAEKATTAPEMVRASQEVKRYSFRKMSTRATSLHVSIPDASVEEEKLFKEFIVEVPSSNRNSEASTRMLMPRKSILSRYSQLYKSTSDNALHDVVLSDLALDSVEKLKSAEALEHS